MDQRAIRLGVGGTVRRALDIRLYRGILSFDTVHERALGTKGAMPGRFHQPVVQGLEPDAPAQERVLEASADIYLNYNSFCYL